MPNPDRGLWISYVLLIGFFTLLGFLIQHERAAKNQRIEQHLQQRERN